jgi:hypothetical protein
VPQRRWRRQIIGGRAAHLNRLAPSQSTTHPQNKLTLPSAPNPNPTPVGVEVEGAGTLPADAVLIAMGPWSGQAAAWLPDCPPVGGQKAHSCVLRPGSTAAAAGEDGGDGNGRAVWSHAVFVSYRDASGRTREPEIYPRPDGSCYVRAAAPRRLSGRLGAAGGCSWGRGARASLPYQPQSPGRPTPRLKPAAHTHPSPPCGGADARFAARAATRPCLRTLLRWPLTRRPRSRGSERWPACWRRS